MKQEVLKAPIRWAGSKKRIMNEMLEVFDKKQKIYIEPFLGSGVVLINLLNNLEFFDFEEFYVNDINSNIINFYNSLKRQKRILIVSIEQIISEYNNITDLKTKSDYYYNMRDKYNNINNGVEKTTIFYFLMKCGFNGVYRENKKGKFNVPFGKKNKIIFNKEELDRISNLIKKVKFYSLDYFTFIRKMEKNLNLDDSFIYMDPPYLHEDLAINQNHRLYTSKDFDHFDFAEQINKFRNTKIMISMAFTKIAKKVYGNQFDMVFIKDIVRTVNPNKKMLSKEVVFINYKLKL